MTEIKSKVIKSQNLDDALSLEAKLNMSDSAHVDFGFDKKIIHSQDFQLKTEADDVLKKALLDADKIKKRAKQIYLDVEKRVRESEAKGYEDGRQEGLQALTEMALNLQKKNQEVLAKLEKQALELVFEMGRKVIGESFVASNEALLGMIRQALQAVMGNQLVVLVHPLDYQRIQAEQKNLMTALHGSQTLILKPAETVQPNSCLIESEMGTLEANLEKQLLAIKNALGVS